MKKGNAELDAKCQVTRIVSDVLGATLTLPWAKNTELDPPFSEL